MRTLVFAPSVTSISPPAFMSVLTEPGCTALTLIGVSRSSWASCTVHAFTALLETL